MTETHDPHAWLKKYRDDLVEMRDRAVVRAQGLPPQFARVWEDSVVTIDRHLELVDTVLAHGPRL